MATDPKLQAAYDRALAVMTSPCRFVEWKAFGGGLTADGFYPIGLDKDPKGYWKEIDSERWIYVFRRYARTKTAAVWVDEIHLEKDGSMESVNTAAALGGADEQPAPKPIGKTLSFARRIHGVAMEYYLLSARIRLPPKLVVEIMGEMESYVHPVNFEPNDGNIVGRDGDVVLVPVLDPLTVAEHLHAFYAEATKDLLRYQFVDKDMGGGEQKATLRRQKKVALARLINAIQLADKSNHLLYWLSRDSLDLEDFLNDYEAQLDFRRVWRDKWAKLLTQWLDSKTMRILAKAHLAKPETDFLSYFLVYCMCLGQVSSSVTGVAFLEKIAGEKDHWIHDYVLSAKVPTETMYQVLRKGTSAGLEALKEFAPLAMRDTSVVPWMTVLEGFEHITETKLIKIDQDLITWTIQRPVKFRTKVVQIGHEPPPLKANWAGGITKVAAVLEIINVGLSIKSLATAMSGDDTTAKILAITNLVGSGLDLASVGLSVFKASEKTIGTVAVVSSMIDTFLAYKDEADAIKKGDTGGAVGSAVVAIGSLEGVLAGLMLIAGVPGGQIVAIAGLAIVAVGQLIKVIWGDNDESVDDSPYIQLMNYCEWGLHKGGDDATADFSPVPFASWPGNLDAQLEAAINLLCSFTLDVNGVVTNLGNTSPDLREAKLKANWFPPGSILQVGYQESWTDLSKNRIWRAAFKMGELGLSAEKGAQLQIKRDGDDTWIVRPIPYPGEPETRKPGLGGFGKVVAPDLQSISIAGRLHVKIADKEIVVPHGKDVTAKLV